MAQMIISRILAWLSVVLLILTMLLWFIRIGSDKKWFKQKGEKSLHEKMKKPHEILGGLLFITSLVHGILSSAKLLSFNWGTASFVAILLLGASCSFKKEENVEKWRIPHRIVGILAVAFLIVHLITIF